jgi:hypothetical protein
MSCIAVSASKQGRSVDLRGRDALPREEAILGRVRTERQEIGIGEVDGSLGHGSTLNGAAGYDRIVRSSGDNRGTRTPIDRLAHAFDPARWTRRWLVIGIVVFAGVAVLTVVQRALIAEGTAGWVVTAVHGAVVVLVVPALVFRTVREWRAVQTSSRVPE